MSVEFKWMARTTSKLARCGWRLVDLSLRLAASRGLVRVGYAAIVNPANVVGGVQWDTQIVNNPPAGPIPNNTVPLPIDLFGNGANPNPSLDPTDHHVMEKILMRIATPPNPGAANNRLLDDIYHQHFLANIVNDAQGNPQIDFSDLHNVAINRGRNWGHMCSLLGREFAGNMKTFIPKQVSKAISRVTKHLMRMHTMAMMQADPNFNQERRDLLVSRTIAALNAKHIHHLPQLNAQNPMFAPGINPAVINIWIAALNPIYELLAYIVPNGHPVENNIQASPMAAAFPSTRSIYNDARNFTFYDVCGDDQAGRIIAVRGYLFLAYADMVCGQAAVNPPAVIQAPAANGRPPPFESPILMCPLPTDHVCRMVHYDYKALLRYIVKPSLRPWRSRGRNFTVLTANHFRIPSVSAHPESSIGANIGISSTSRNPEVLLSI